MKILPVLDLLQGQVVRGVAGRRRDYRPVVSRLTTSAHPLDVSRALHAHLGLREFYLADLDAIEGRDPALATYASLQEEGYRLWVDAGVVLPDRARLLARAGVAGIVIGLETVAGPEALADVVREWGECVI